MKDFICVLLTSETCGHCSHMRGNGVIGNKKPMTSYNYLKNLLVPDKAQLGITMLNIHFSTMNGTRNQIMDISKIKVFQDRILQEKYKNREGKAFVDVFVLKDKAESSIRVDSKEVLIDNKKIDWLDFVNKKINKSIENYIFYFPCFVLFQKEDWKSGDNILGITNAGIVVEKENGVYELEKNSRSLNSRNVQINDLIKDIFSGSLSFKPQKSLRRKENEKKEKKEEKKVKFEEPKKENFSKCGFLVKDYDDE